MSALLCKLVRFRCLGWHHWRNVEALFRGKKALVVQLKGRQLTYRPHYNLIRLHFFPSNREVHYGRAWKVLCAVGPKYPCSNPCFTTYCSAFECDQQPYKRCDTTKLCRKGFASCESFHVMVVFCSPVKPATGRPL
jgi:hypothetical protein